MSLFALIVTCMQLEEVPDKAAKVEKMESTMNKKRVQNAALWN